MLLWCDGFDHYGIIGNMTEGPYAEIGSGVTLLTTNPRTGTHHLHTPSSGNVVSTNIRRVFGGAKTTVGLAAVFYYAALPSVADTTRVFDFRDANNITQLTIQLDTTGVITVKRGESLGGVVLGSTASPVITAETYQHIEAMVLISQTVGTVEIRVNGVTVLSLSGIDTAATSLVEASQCGIGGTNRGANVTLPVTDIDDIFCYDDTGSFNNTFIGDRRVLTLFPDADTVQADWTPVGSGTGFGAIDEANPDGDTTYITAATTGHISEFGIQNLPAGISAISGVVLVEMARKTEAGAANTQWSVISGASETAGADKPMTEVYTYRQDVFETDPASAAPFTPAEVDALLIKVERTA